MDFLNMNNIKRFLWPLVLLFIGVVIIQGIFALIPIALFGILAYKGYKFIQAKFSRFKNTKNSCNKSSKEYIDNGINIYNSKVIDVEYEDANK